MFKGFDKVDSIQYIYTSIQESLCGVKLDAKNKGQYLLSGKSSINSVSIQISQDEIGYMKDSNFVENVLV